MPRDASADGNFHATYMMSVMNSNGYGMLVDKTMGGTLFRKAAAGGDNCLTDFVNRVAPVRGVRAHLGGPAAVFDGFGPCRAGQHRRAFNFIKS